MVDWISLRLTVTAMRSEGWIDKESKRKCVGGNQEREVRQRKRKTEIEADCEE